MLVRNTKRVSQPQQCDSVATRVNFLTRGRIAFLKRAVDQLVNHPEYERYCVRDTSTVDCCGRKLECALPESITKHPLLYGTAGKASQTLRRLVTSALFPETCSTYSSSG